MNLAKNAVISAIGALLLGCSQSANVQQSRIEKLSTSNANLEEEKRKKVEESPTLSSKTKTQQISNNVETANHPRKKTNSKKLGSDEISKSTEKSRPKSKQSSNTEKKISQQQAGDKQLPPAQNTDGKPTEENHKASSSKSKADSTTHEFIFPEFYAPAKYKHPLRNTKNLTFMIGEDSEGSYLYGEGPIISGAYEKFLKYVEHYKSLGVHLDRLMLHSPGGVLNEGIKIGEYLLDNNWKTDADKYMRCYSTCGFIYAAGVSKRIQDGAEVGFHRPYLPQVEDTPEFIEQVYNEYQGYWRAVGGSPELYNKFMREYGREDMYILNTHNIRRYMHVEKY